MSLYAMSDLHLSFAKPKPMDVFDPIWKDHPQKIKQLWNDTVGSDDTVLVPGDISWGGRLNEAMPDLDFVAALNGKKILMAGNHDYFWNSTQKLNSLYNNMFFMKNTYCDYNGMAICGSRGWLCPNDTLFTDRDMKIYNREVMRMQKSIQAAADKGYKDLTVIMHFPPTNDKHENSGFIDIFKQYKVKRVIYGHLHNENSFNASLKGNVGGIDYFLVSADYLMFKPIKIL